MTTHETIDHIEKTQGKLEELHRKSVRRVEIGIVITSVIALIAGVVMAEPEEVTASSIFVGLAIEGLGAWLTFRLLEKTWNELNERRSNHLKFVEAAMRIASRNSFAHKLMDGLELERNAIITELRQTKALQNELVKRQFNFATELEILEPEARVAAENNDEKSFPTIREKASKMKSELEAMRAQLQEFDAVNEAREQKLENIVSTQKRISELMAVSEEEMTELELLRRVYFR